MREEGSLVQVLAGKRRRLLLGIAVVGVLALAGVVLLSGRLGSQDKLPPDVGEPDPAAGWPVPTLGNRIYETPEPSRYPGFSFCVEAIDVDPGLEGVAKARIEEALLEVTQHPHWNLFRRGRTSIPPLVDIGCPTGPLIARPGVDWEGYYSHARGNLHQYDVTKPSFYWTFVFVIPARRINELLDGNPVQLAPQEYTSQGDVSFVETMALFLSPQDLEDRPLIVKQLLIAVGLESAFPENEYPDRSSR